MNEVACTNRRRIIAALPAVVLLPGVLTACSNSSTVAGPTRPGDLAAGLSDSGESIDISDIAAGEAAVVLVTGGAVVVAVDEQNAVHVYDATCPHKGTRVITRSQGRIMCPAHGSEFDSFTGNVTSGPARGGLAKMKHTRQGNTVTITKA